VPTSPEKSGQPVIQTRELLVDFCDDAALFGKWRDRDSEIAYVALADLPNACARAGRGFHLFPNDSGVPTQSKESRID
jgi:hypothetical protein